MQVSYSRISTYKNCPYQFKLRYIDNLETVFNCDPQNPLIIGSALHKGIEVDVDTAIKEYYAAYPVIKDAHITEAMKLEYLIPKVKKLLPDGKHEVYIEHPDFHGYIDLLVPRGYMAKESIYNPYGKDVNVYDIYDFKYSNNINGYMESAQLHLYKYFFELTNPSKRIRNLYFVFVPKCNLKMKYKNKTNPRDETIYEFRNRCLEDLKSKEIQIMPVQYNPNKIAEFLIDTKHCVEDTTFEKHQNRLCDWCEYKSYCEKGENLMILPKNERRERVLNTTPDMWIYADSYVGKSTFVDSLDNVLFVNTDGNTDNITSPYVSIADEIIHEGRITKKVMAWEKFLELVAELEKGENDFKVIALDLLEDLYEQCRLYMYDKLKIEHEQDAGFGKGWDMVRTEFLTTIKRLKHLGYRIIYISKELKTEINLKNGAKLTTFAPNLPDKVANILAGTVTLTIRAYMDNRGRFLQLAKQESVFGGGRFNFVNDKCELSMKAFVEELKLAQGDIVPVEKPAEKTEKPAEEAKLGDEFDGNQGLDEVVKAEEPKAEEPKPATRRRKRRTE